MRGLLQIIPMVPSTHTPTHLLLFVSNNLYAEKSAVLVFDEDFGFLSFVIAGFFDLVCA